MVEFFGLPDAVGEPGQARVSSGELRELADGIAGAVPDQGFQDGVAPESCTLRSATTLAEPARK